VLASAKMARALSHALPQIAIPESLAAAVESDRDAGVNVPCEQILALRDSGAFEGFTWCPSAATGRSPPGSNGSSDRYRHGTREVLAGTF
jgi:hypothetical protein